MASKAQRIRLCPQPRPKGECQTRQAIVREVVRYGRYCPCCQRYQRAEAPQGFEQGRVVGENLEQLVLYLHYAHPLSYERVARILGEVYGLALVRRHLSQYCPTGESRLKQAANAIREQVKQAKVVGSDETTARVDGLRSGLKSR